MGISKSEPQVVVRQFPCSMFTFDGAEKGKVSLTEDVVWEDCIGGQSYCNEYEAVFRYDGKLWKIRYYVMQEDDSISTFSEYPNIKAVQVEEHVVVTTTKTYLPVTDWY